MNAEKFATLFRPAERNLPAMLDAQAARFGDKPLVTASGTTLSFREARELAAGFGGTLLRAGIKRGDRVALICGNSLDFVEEKQRFSRLNPFSYMSFQSFQNPFWLKIFLKNSANVFGELKVDFNDSFEAFTEFSNRIGLPHLPSSSQKKRFTVFCPLPLQQMPVNESFDHKFIITHSWSKRKDKLRLSWSKRKVSYKLFILRMLLINFNEKTAYF